MWDKIILRKKEKRKTSLFFSDWLDQYVFTERYERKARELFGIAEEIDPLFGKLRNIVQAPPYHSEGPFVMHGVERGLAGLYAITEGANLFSIEDFAREKHYKEELLSLEDILLEHVASLTVYMLFHDLGKSSTITFSAPVGSLGAVEGFFQHKYRVKARANQSEQILYLKLFKAYHSQHTNESMAEVMAGFFDRYEIYIHYPEHEKDSLAIGMDAFSSLSDHFRLRPKERELVLFAVRNHMRAIYAFAEGPDERAYELLMSRAHKAGLDADEAIDFLLAAIFLDASIGSLIYKDGEFCSGVDIVLHVLRSEEQVAPHRRAQRRVAQEVEKERRLRFAMKEAGLDGQSLFSLLKTPFGPERGRISAEIRSYVLHPHQKVTLDAYRHEITRRVEKARALFDV